ncbi:MAG: hypothetical protein ACRD0P_08340, partial [Stackebrandtia sp.]
LGDLDDADSLKRALEHSYGVFSVQPLGITEAELEAEIRRGAVTVQYANELRGDDVLVNAPGYVDTDINGHTGILTPAQAAAGVVRVPGHGGANRCRARAGRCQADTGPGLL